MTHLEASKSQAAERYLLGELPPNEAEEFELHYFECSQCAIAVESGSEFIANARASLADGRHASREIRTGWRKPWWETWMLLCRQPAFALPVVAALLLGAAALYQQAVLIPGIHRVMETPRILPAFQLAGASRGEAAKVLVPAGAPYLSLSFDVPPGETFSRYLCVASANATPTFRVTSPAPAEGKPLTILVPSTAVTRGPMSLAVFGLTSAGQAARKVSEYSFDLQFTP